MPKKYTQARLSRELVSTALELNGLSLWRELDNDQCFAVIVPDEEHPMIASVMGQGGMEFGLNMFRGESVGRDIVEMLEDEPREEDAADEVSFMGFSISRFSEVPPFSRTILKKAGPCAGATASCRASSSKMPTGALAASTRTRRASSCTR